MIMYSPKYARILIQHWIVLIANPIAYCLKQMKPSAHKLEYINFIMTKRNQIKDFTSAIKHICTLLHVPLLEITNVYKKKRTVVYVVTIAGDTVEFKAYAAYSKEDVAEEEKVGEESRFTLINAEEQFIEKNELWVADIKKVFTDYTVTLEGKFGPLVWCGTPYRSTMEEFHIDSSQLLMTSQYNTATLNRLSPIKTSELGISVDEQPRMISASLEEVNSKMTSQQAKDPSLESAKVNSFQMEA